MEIKYENIYDFLKKGVIAGIRVGMKRTDLLKAYENDLDFGTSLNDSEIYYLRNFEIIIYEDLVSNIILNGRVFDNISVEYDSIFFIIYRQTSINEIVSLFKKLQLIWSFSKDYTTDKSIAIVTEGWVYILFDYLDSEPNIEKIGI